MLESSRRYRGRKRPPSSGRRNGELLLGGRFYGLQIGLTQGHAIMLGDAQLEGPAASS
ncbi:hypothetical protein UMZ34_15860 [Halopseudomonas pachastrellae]|nr:hypothetical protein UMZ34_15860 [Halopseudomonas pachastrellae]